MGYDLSFEQISALNETERQTLDDQLKKTTILGSLTSSGNLLTRSANFYANLKNLRDSLGYGDENSFQIYDFEGEPSFDL